MKDLRTQIAEVAPPRHLESMAEPPIVARLFALGSAATWYVAEYEPGADLIFGYVDLYGTGEQGGAEWGYTNVGELMELMYGPIPRVEFDVHFKPGTLAECLARNGHRPGFDFVVYDEIPRPEWDEWNRPKARREATPPCPQCGVPMVIDIDDPDQEWWRCRNRCGGGREMKPAEIQKYRIYKDLYGDDEVTQLEAS